MFHREIVPPPAMSRDHFIKKFGKQGKFSTVPLDMIHGAFDELDQDGDGNRSPSRSVERASLSDFYSSPDTATSVLVASAQLWRC